MSKCSALHFAFRIILHGCIAVCGWVPATFLLTAAFFCYHFVHSLAFFVPCCWLYSICWFCCCCHRVAVPPLGCVDVQFCAAGNVAIVVDTALDYRSTTNTQRAQVYCFCCFWCVGLWIALPHLGVWCCCCSCTAFAHQSHNIRSNLLCMPLHRNYNSTLDFGFAACDCCSCNKYCHLIKWCDFMLFTFVSHCWTFHLNLSVRCGFRNL